MIVHYDEYYKYTFRLSPDILPEIICFNSRIWKGKKILKCKSINDINLGNFNNIAGTKIFARSWNILNYMSGAGGLHYS